MTVWMPGNGGTMDDDIGALHGLAEVGKVQDIAPYQGRD